MEGGTPDNRGALKGVLCEKGGRGALVNMEPLKLYSSRALFGIDPHRGSVYPHSGCLFYEGMEGGTPDNRGALDFQHGTQWLCVATQELCVLYYRGNP